MIRRSWNCLIQTGVFSLLLLLLSGCSQQGKDKEIKADLTAKAKEDKNFAGVRFMVNNGIVTLSGECPTAQAKDKVESTVKRVYAVKEVTNNIAIAPVIIGTDQQLKQGVDSILSKYPGVEAIVIDSMVRLQGQAESKDQEKLLSAVKTLQPRNLESQILFK
jgi:osmotically-inducible protein OsmY